MTSNNGVKNKEKQDLKGVDASVLGQIMAAQNILFVLPTGKNIAEFFAKSLYTLPGIVFCCVCIGNSFSQEGEGNYNICSECTNNTYVGEENHTISKNFVCRLGELPNSYVFALETFDHRFGFFIFGIEQPDLFDLYKPFINNLGNFVALSLENRLQKSDLQKVQNVLEKKVKERTSELQTLNTHLEEEIEARKRTENALQQSEEHFRFLFETMAQGVIIQDAESKIIDANDAACEILGLSKDQLLGKTAYDPRWKLIHEDGSNLFPEQMPSNIALRTCKPVIDTLIGAYIPEINTHHWILTSSTPKFKDGDSSPYLTMTTFTDITERKIAEEEIQKLNQELEKRVVERTIQLESANKELEAFAYSVSHDLRAPLRGIDGFSEILLEQYQDKVDEQGKNYLHRIRAATQRMSELIEDMLNLSRIIRSKMDVNLVKFSEIAHEIAGNYLENNTERNVEFIIQDGITIQGDGRLLRIVLENLIGNAWKFTSKHSSARIEFGTQQQDNRLVYFIRDDGAGFDMQYAQRLFGAFQRLHTESEFPGTGIGLATVQRIINRHGGALWAEGEIEKGATFYFTIP
jgi:PAS domain S-box-containing protein